MFGKGKDKHDKNLRGVLQRLKGNNLRLNKDKCEFSKSEIRFYGHIVNSSGVKPDSKKVEAIRSASPLQNASDIKSLLGMTQYASRFIPNYATIRAP